jgi:hypothetical protein
MDVYFVVKTVLILFLLWLPISSCWRILRRAGYHGAWSLLIFIPLLNLVALYIFSKIKWPGHQALPLDGAVGK